MWKKITLLVIEVNKIVFQRAMCSNSNDSDTTKNSQQSITPHYLFLGSYLWKLQFLLLLPSSFPEAILLPRRKLSFARIPGCSWPYQDTGEDWKQEHTASLQAEERHQKAVCHRLYLMSSHLMVGDPESWEDGGEIQGTVAAEQASGSTSQYKALSRPAHHQPQCCATPFFNILGATGSVCDFGQFT